MSMFHGREMSARQVKKTFGLVYGEDSIKQALDAGATDVDTLILRCEEMLSDGHARRTRAGRKGGFNSPFGVKA